MVKQTWKGLLLSQKSNIREIGIICACSDHGQPRYQIWIKCDKRQMTSYVHKMCGRMYGQTNMKRAITLAKINHPWNRYSMCMLRSWPTKIPNMNKIKQDKWLVTYTRFRDGRTNGQGYSSIPTTLRVGV
jgi:hypothetical protein